MAIKYNFKISPIWGEQISVGTEVLGLTPDESVKGIDSAIICVNSGAIRLAFVPDPTTSLGLLVETDDIVVLDNLKTIEDIRFIQSLGAGSTQVYVFYFNKKSNYSFSV